MAFTGSIVCPSCGSDVEWRRVPSLCRCERCGAGLRLRPGAERLLMPLAILFALLIGALYGGPVKAIWELSAAVLATTHLVLFLFEIRIFKPRIDLRDGMAGVMSRARHYDPAEVQTFEGLTGTGKPRRRLFDFPNPPRTLEGFAIAFVAVAITGWQVVVNADPVVAWVYPEFRATRTAPAGFPLTVHIGADALRLTNGSSDAWYCYVSLGKPPTRMTITSPVRVAPHASFDLPFKEFRNLDTGPDAALRRRAARDSTRVQCVESSGRSHYASL